MVVNNEKPLLSRMISIIDEFENRQFEENNKVYAQKKGIVYTPKNIVDFIVNNVIMRYVENKCINLKILQKNQEPTRKNFEHLLEDKMLRKELCEVLENIKILDPSCGSGRFLLSVAEFLFQFLKIACPQRSEQELRKNILEKSLYGVEIEKEANWISQLRLIYWYLSNETEYDEKLDELNIINDKTIQKIKETIHIDLNVDEIDYLMEFESIDKFSIVLGNPPYVENKKNKDQAYKKKLVRTFYSAYKLFDLSILFIEKSLSIVEKGGYIVFVLTNKFLSSDYGVRIRKLIMEKTLIEEIMNISSLGIFGKKAAYPIILFLRNAIALEDYSIKIKTFEAFTQIEYDKSKNRNQLPSSLVKKLPEQVIPISGDLYLIEYLFLNYKPMGEIFPGLKITYRPFGFLKWERYFDYISDKKKKNKDLILLGTGNLGKYRVLFDKNIRIANRDLKVSYFQYNEKFKDIWDVIKQEKLVFREIAKELTFIYDPGIFINITGLYFLTIPDFKTDKLFCLLAILNSRVMNSIFSSLYGTLHMSGGYLRYNGSYIKRLPVPGELPRSLSYMGRIIQFLSQLEYDLRSISYRGFSNYPEIESYLAFFVKLNDAMVYLLYFEKLHPNDYKGLKTILWSTEMLPKIEFKYYFYRFEFSLFKNIQDPELVKYMEKIRVLYNSLKNKEIMQEIASITKHY